LAVAATIFLLAVFVAHPSYAQPPSTTPPATVSHKARPRDPNCNPPKTSASRAAATDAKPAADARNAGDAAPPTVPSAPATVVSAPPATVPAIADPPAPGAVNVPVPTLPDAGRLDLGVNANAGKSALIGSPCATDDADAPTKKLRELA